MKKFLYVFLIGFVSLFSLTGCGISESHEPTDIKFVKDVFYVDFGVNTFLDYKIYPSSAEGQYVVSYPPPEGDYTIESYYRIVDGSFIIYNSAFSYDDEVKVTIKLNEHQDTCIVKLKEYPKLIKMKNSDSVVSGDQNNKDYNSSDYIQSGSVYPIKILGEFANGGELLDFSGGNRECLNGEFNYEIESSDPSVVEVVSNENLLVRSTGRRGSSRITIKILDSQGQEKEGLKVYTDLTVCESISDSYVTFNNNSVITDGLTKEINANTSDQFEIDVKYFTLDGFLVDLADFDCLLSNRDVVEVVKQGDKTYIKVILEPEFNKLTEEEKDSLSEEELLEYKTITEEVKIVLQSTTLDGDGNLVRVGFVLKVQVSV